MNEGWDYAADEAMIEEQLESSEEEEPQDE